MKLKKILVAFLIISQFVQKGFSQSENNSYHLNNFDIEVVGELERIFF